MGFYGQVFYEISNAFATIAVRNLAGNTVDLKATGTGGTLTMAPGEEDKWIDMYGKNYTCFVKHVTPYFEQSVVPTIKKSATNQSSATVLQPGDYVDMPTFTVDEAGHVSKISISQFRLPINEVEDKTQQLETAMTELEARVNNTVSTLSNSVGDLSDKFDAYDGDIETVNNAAQKGIADNAAAIEANAGDISINRDNISTNANNIQTNADGIVTNKSNIEALQKIVGDSKLSTKEQDSITITGILGNMEEFIYDSVAEGMTELTARANGSDASISSQALAMKTIINNLCAIINENAPIKDSEGNQIQLSYNYLINL